MNLSAVRIGLPKAGIRQESLASAMAAASAARSGQTSTKRVSQPFGCVARVPVRVGTFNLGLHQEQIGSTQFPRKALKKVCRVVAKGFEEGNLHLLNLCEVGGHKQGLEANNISPSRVTDGALVQGYGSQTKQAYLSIWHERGAQQPGGVSLNPLQSVEVHPIPATLPFDAQLVVSTYAVTKYASKASGILICGQLHIRAPNDMKSPGGAKLIEARQKVVRQAFKILEKASNNFPIQRTVAVLCGDVNLYQADADACCQVQKGVSDVHTHWHTETSNEALLGDVAFIRGCESRLRCYHRCELRRPWHQARLP